MALEFLLASEISNEKINLPIGATHYYCKSGKVRIFKVNPSATKKMKEIPKGASFMLFNMEKYAHHIDYGKPQFYDLKGNHLKLAIINISTISPF